MHHPDLAEQTHQTLDGDSDVLGKDKLVVHLPIPYQIDLQPSRDVKSYDRKNSLQLQLPRSVKCERKTSWGCTTTQNSHQKLNHNYDGIPKSVKKAPKINQRRQKKITENPNFRSVLGMFKEMEKTKSSEAENESKSKPRNGSQPGPVISTKVKKLNVSSSKKKKLKSSTEIKTVNDIRKYFEKTSKFKVESDFTVEKSKLDGSWGILAENNTNQYLAKEHQQLLTPIHDNGLSVGCQVPRESNDERRGLTPNENEKQVRKPPKAGSRETNSVVC